MRKIFKLRRNTRLIAGGLAIGVSSLLLISCGGGDNAVTQNDDDDITQMSADVPAAELAQAAIVPEPALGRLVYGSAQSDSQASFDFLKQYFTTQTAFSSGSDLKAGDVLVLDGRTVQPKDLSEVGQLAHQAFTAQVPILIIGFDDVLEEAIHKLLPTASVPGFNAFALITPPRAGQPWNDGGITVTQSQLGTSKDLTPSRSTMDSLIEQLRGYRNKSLSAGSSQLSKQGSSASTSSDGSSSPCTADNPEYCGQIVQTSLATIHIIEDFRFNGLQRPTNCLSQDWTIWNSAGRRHYAALADKKFATYNEPQCPSQVWLFSPVLYLNSPLNAPPSRVVYLGLDGSFNPRVAQRGNNELAWYQTRRRVEVKPDAPGIQWLSNLPLTRNSEHTVTDTRGWSLNGSVTAGQGPKGPIGTGTFGFSVNYSHTTSNVIPDWKLIDTTDAANAIWRFEAQQVSPYPVNDDTSANCANMGSAMFSWDATHCRSLPRHVKTTAANDLSVNNATLQGMAVWDLGSQNNNLHEVNFTVNTSSWFDAVGCTLLTKKSTGGVPGETILNPKILKSPNCASNQSLPPNAGTWYRRAQRDASFTLTVDPSLLPLK